MKLRSLFTKNHTKTKLANWEILALFSALAIFAVLSTVTIGKSSIWFDEAFSAYIIRWNFVEIWQFTAVDVHPPLYYWLLKAWGMIFGTTDVALRSMSVLFGGVAIVFGYLLMRRNFGQKAALYGLLVIVLSPVLIRYSQEMRMYTLVLAIALAATYILQEAIKSGRKLHWALYGVLIALGMWTHYFSAIVWLAHWVWRAFAVRARKKPKSLIRFFSKEWIWTHVLAVCLFLPWLPAMFIQMGVVQSAGFWIPPVSLETIASFFTGLTLYSDQASLNTRLTLGFMMLAGVVVALSVMGYKWLDKNQKLGYGLILALAFVPVILLVLASLPPLQPSFMDRYLVVSSLAFSLLIGLALWFSTKLKSRGKTVAVHVLVIGSMIIGLANVYHYGNYNKFTGQASGAKQIAAKTRQHTLAPILADDAWVYYDIAAYETADSKVYFKELESYDYGSLEMLKTKDHGKITNEEEFTGANKMFWHISRSGEELPGVPFDNVEQIAVVEQPDPFTGKPAYQAVLYVVSAE